MEQSSDPFDNWVPYMYLKRVNGCLINVFAYIVLTPKDMEMRWAIGEHQQRYNAWSDVSKSFVSTIGADGAIFSSFKSSKEVMRYIEENKDAISQWIKNNQ